MKPTAYIAASLLACAPLAFVHPVKVEGGSMEPGLGDGQVALALWRWCSGEPALGQVWVLDGPDGPVVKRVLALPGQVLEQRNGYLIRSGQILEEPYISFREIGDGGPWSAHGGYLVLGDNRRQSRDSRLWGSIPKKTLRGRVLVL